MGNERISFNLIPNSWKYRKVFPTKKNNLFSNNIKTKRAHKKNAVLLDYYINKSRQNFLRVTKLNYLRFLTRGTFWFFRDQSEPWIVDLFSKSFEYLINMGSLIINRINR